MMANYPCNHYYFIGFILKHKSDTEVISKKQLIGCDKVQRHGGRVAVEIIS